MNSIDKTNKEVFASRWKNSLTLCLIIATALQVSCKKFVEVPPPDYNITGDVVFTDDASAISVLTELYSSFNRNPIQGGFSAGSIFLFAGLAVDEYKLNGGIITPNYVGYYTNALTADPTKPSGSEHWTFLYNAVFKCNAAIEGLNASTTLLPLVKKQLLGEAKFMRAFFYFYLVNMFGDVPLALSTDPEINTLLPRSSKESVYDQIKKDLTEAKEQLSDNFLDPTLLVNTTERVRPTKWAAMALLARVYLYTGEWTNAEAQSTAVISNTALFNLPDSLNDVFLKNGKEAIWQIQPTDASFNTFDARTLIIPASGPSPGSLGNPVQLSPFLLNSFESNDKRAINGKWINSVTAGATIYKFPYKYKIYLPNSSINAGTGTINMTEYFMVLRLGEQYLIRAEARARQGNLIGAID
ncbi:MAG TPA: RagB/SusD family nutrient uptake outer membrane protein, partial [Chitinophagaceae bacterium]|nr:RagB/SusD family nutrient uptake outer membrane protein [Chitinophagaceae bacterium]